MKIRNLILIVFLGCLSQKAISQALPEVIIDTLVSEKISIRAIEFTDNNVWYVGNRNQMGKYNFKTGKMVEFKIEVDTLQLEFRSMAKGYETFLVANIGSPAFIFKVDWMDLSIKKVYTENHEKAFYDSMKFWNDKEGIVIGDPTEDCLSILITRDYGKSWKKLDCAKLPKIADGEAAFAASNTNICVRGKKTWVVTGGKKARVLYSPNKGKTWEVYETPIVQGQTMTGIFTADFYDEKIGFIAGGNYEKPEQNFQNKAITHDGGKTWELIGENTGPGYISCVQFVPKSNGKKIITVGATGIHYSSDSGYSWTQLSPDKTLFTIRFVDEATAFAAGKNKIIRIQFKR